MTRCSHCGSSLRYGADFCPRCGQRRESERITCDRCELLNRPDARFCAHCGIPVTAARTAEQPLARQNIEIGPILEEGKSPFRIPFASHHDRHSLGPDGSTARRAMWILGATFTLVLTALFVLPSRESTNPGSPVGDAFENGHLVTDILRLWHDQGEAPDGGWNELERLARLHFLADSTSPEARAHLAYARAQKAFVIEDYDRAIHLYDEAIQHANGWGLAYNGKGRSCWRNGDTGCAIRAFQAAVQSDPDWIFPYLNLAAIYMESDRSTTRIESLLEEVLALEPSSLVGHYRYAEFLFGNARYTQAKVALQRVVDLDDQAPPEHVSRKLHWLQKRGY